jgi:putative addiction module component (TIGR02574 family)
MSKPITIENLSIIEKIELMEKLWEDLSSSPDYSPPAWHGEELARRKNAVKEGKISYTEWDKAKEVIRKETIRLYLSNIIR